MNKLLGLAMAGVFALAVAGCGASNKESSAGTTTASGQNMYGNTAPAPQGTATNPSTGGDANNPNNSMNDNTTTPTPTPGDTNSNTNANPNGTSNPSGSMSSPSSPQQ